METQKMNLAVKNPVLYYSERLYLSPISEEHAEDYAKWINDPEIFGHIRNMSCSTNGEEQKIWIRQSLQDPTQRSFNIFHIPDDQLIGNGGFKNIHWEDGKAELGIVIGWKKYQGTGLGSEATWLICKYGFEELKFHNILAEINSDNSISINVSQKLGFHFMGIRRQSHRVGDKRLDIQYFDMLPHELIKPGWKPKP
jgi:RimJ/RimL family protein N-acetyltransferase